jgi:quercetin dioxygenase-like cupin family protein
MEIYNFGKEQGKSISQYNSEFIMTRIMMAEKGVHIGCMYLDENGIIGRHEATTPQLLIVVDGVGFVSGEDGDKVEVAAGDAVFWKSREMHDTTTIDGLTAIVIEGEDVQPTAMKLK